MTKISKRTIDALMIEGGRKPIRDSELKGFGARLNVDHSVSYFVEFRAGKGRGFPVRRIVLGRRGRITAEEARDLAKKTLARVVCGDDPAQERADRRKEMTVADLLRHVLASHWEPKAKASTATNFRGMIERTLIPKFGSTKLSSLRRIDIRQWHASQTHRPRQANLDVAILRKALAIAVSDELLDDNPAMGIKSHPERKRDRVPSDAEMLAILNAIDAAAIRPQAALLFKLLIYTGCRTGEWRTAEWGWLDPSGQVLRLPAAKSGARSVALSGPVQALLAVTPRAGRYIVPDDTGAAPLPPWSVNDAWEAVRRLSGVQDVNVHDLRHAFATRGAGLGASALVLRDALGHRTMAMTSRYVSHQTNPVRDLGERIAAQIDALRSGKSAEVVPLRGSGDG